METVINISLFSIGILLILVAFNWKKFFSIISQRVNRKKSSLPSTPVSTGTHPPPAGHATPKSKSRFTSRFFNTVGVIIALAVTVLIVFWVIGFVGGVIKKWNAPKPHYSTYTVQTVKTVSISNTGGYNTVYVPWKADARFVNATIAFCVKNNLGQSVCGDAGSDSNLPKGTNGEGQTLWFIPRDDPNQSGTIDILITEIKEKVDYY